MCLQEGKCFSTAMSGSRAVRVAQSSKASVRGAVEVGGVVRL